jgi:hypothetical protein
MLPETKTDPPFDFLRVLTWIDFSHVTRVSDAPDVLEHLLTAVQGGQPSAEACRGDEDIDAKRSRPSIGKTRLWVIEPVSSMQEPL